MKKLNEIQQKLNAPKGQRNDFGKYNYRSCEDILKAVKPLLGEAVITLSDEIVSIGSPLQGMHHEKTKDGKLIDRAINIGERFYVRATATLTHGQEEVSVTAYAREEHDKKGMDGAQITGAASSYARKYALNGLFCIDDAKDADSTNTHGKEDVDSAESEAQRTTILLAPYVKSTKLTEEAVRAILKANGIDTHKKLSYAKHEDIIKLLKGEKNE